MPAPGRGNPKGAARPLVKDKALPVREELKTPRAEPSAGRNPPQGMLINAGKARLLPASTPSVRIPGGGERSATAQTGF